MSRFKSRQDLLDEIEKEWKKLTDLLSEMADGDMVHTVTDSMSVKDIMAHRTEWGRMLERWYKEAKKGKKPKVPSEKYDWDQLIDLNTEIRERFKDVPLKKVKEDFQKVHDRVIKMVDKMSDEELFGKGHFEFTGPSDLATYINSSTAAHYRSAQKHIKKWWKQYSKAVED